MPTFKQKEPAYPLILLDEQPGNLFLQEKYNRYVEAAVKGGITAAFVDLEKLSIFIGTDLRNAVLEYYSDSSNYRYTLDVVLFMKVIEGTAKLCTEMERNTDAEHQKFYKVNISDLKVDLFSVEKEIKDRNGIDSAAFEKINSKISDLDHLSSMLVGESKIRAELKEHPMEFIEQPVKKIEPFMPSPDDAELIYKAVRSKYDLFNAPESFEEFKAIIGIVLTGKNSGTISTPVSFEPKPDYKIGVFLLHAYISMLNSTHLKEDIDDAEMLSSNKVPAALPEKIRSYIGIVTGALVNMSKSPMPQKKGYSDKENQIYG